MLRLKEGTFCSGVVRYLDHDPLERHPQARIWIEVGAGSPEIRWLAMVDTAAAWCIVQPAVAEALSLSSRPEHALSTRLGVARGELHRVPLSLHADEGRSLIVEATLFCSMEWLGPSFIGYQGFLERVRFAVDPANRRFFFGKT
jgi:hypothetical protein